MDSNMTNRNTNRLEEIIDQLTDEYQFCFLGVLEALNYAQNAIEMPIEETEEHNNE